MSKIRQSEMWGLIYWSAYISIQWEKDRYNFNYLSMENKEIELWHITQWMWSLKTLGRKFSSVSVLCFLTLKTC